MQTQDIGALVEQYRHEGISLTDRQMSLWLRSLGNNTSNNMRVLRYDKARGAYELYQMISTYMDRTPRFVVYNPASDSMESHWAASKRCYYRNKFDKNIEVPVSGVFNPISERVEWKEGNTHYNWVYNHPVPIPFDGAFNPVSGKVEWKEGDSNGGYGLGHVGVFNPSVKRVEWKQNDAQGLYYGKIHGVPFRGEFSFEQNRIIWTLMN